MGETNEQPLFDIPETNPAEPVDTSKYAAAAAAAADHRTIDYDEREASEEAINQGYGKVYPKLKSGNDGTAPNGLAK
jgi:hypothetical protein